MENKERFLRVWDKFCSFYRSNGNKGMAELWGGYFREERDIVFHLGRLCSEEFGIGHVHLDSPVNKFFFESFPTKDELTTAGKKRRRYHIDLDITDPEIFATRGRKHGIFVEVKWIYKDLLKATPYYGSQRLELRINGIEEDLKKLSANLQAGDRCEDAFMCAIDDEKAISNKLMSEWMTRYPSVTLLLLQP